MRVNKNKMVLTLLIHTKTASFSWGQSIIEHASRYTRQQGIQLAVIYDWQQAEQLDPGSFVLVSGSEEQWLEDTLSHLKALSLQVILLEGVSENYHDIVSQVTSSPSTFIENSLELLRRQGRTKTALFGCQFMDTSDAEKAETFARLVSDDDVFSFNEWIDPCFDLFDHFADDYDSVICANDLIAVYLMMKCRKHALLIPENLMVIGNGNLKISSCMQPSLTTCCYDMESAIAVAVQICKSFSIYPNISNMVVSVKPKMLERESTGHIWDPSQEETVPKTLYQQDRRILDNTRYSQCPELLEIKALDAALSACTPMDLQILQALIDGKTYEAIAEVQMLSKDTIKYHIRKLYRLFDIHRREELLEIVNRYHLCFA